MYRHQDFGVNPLFVFILRTASFTAWRHLACNTFTLYLYLTQIDARAQCPWITSEQALIVSVSARGPSLLPRESMRPLATRPDEKSEKGLALLSPSPSENVSLTRLRALHERKNARPPVPCRGLAQGEITKTSVHAHLEYRRHQDYKWHELKPKLKLMRGITVVSTKIWSLKEERWERDRVGTLRQVLCNLQDVLGIIRVMSVPFSNQSIFAESSWELLRWTEPHGITIAICNDLRTSDCQNDCKISDQQG